MKSIRLLCGATTLGVCLMTAPPVMAQRSGDYDRATRALDRKEYDQALSGFDAVARAKGDRADGALYWKAYTLSRLGRQQEALAAVAELQKTYPESRWLNDAKALDVELRARSGQPARPDQESDDDLKLMALNGLMQQDPNRALPTLQKLLQGNSSRKLKERALFVMAQSGSPQARDMLVQVAKGGGNPDLQMKAIEYLGVFGGDKNGQLLTDIYNSNPDTAVRRRILHSFLIMHNTAKLSELARGEKNMELRKTAIELLGASGGHTELAQLYPVESSAEVKRAIVNGLFISHAVNPLIQIARTEKDPQLKKAVVEKLSLMHSKEASDYMMEILNKD